MAFGFPAYHVEDFRSPKSQYDLIAVTAHAVHALGWKIRAVEQHRVTATVPFSLFSMSEDLEVIRTAADTCRIRSRCTWPTQIFDWGKNRRNVEKLTQEINRQIQLNQNPMSVPPPPMSS